MPITPPKLQKGDEVRILAPSDSMSGFDKQNLELSKKKLESLGFKVSYGKNVMEINNFGTSPVESRIEDLHQAFADTNVKMILPVIGGLHSNQLLSNLNWNLITNNPKILGGYSDTSALQNAIYAKTGLVTYSSIAFVMMAKSRNNQYSFDSFLKCLASNEPYEIEDSKFWDDSQWWQDQESYEIFQTSGHVVINHGHGEGRILGGNLGTFRLLQGTEFFPNQDTDYIYFLEDCSPITAKDFLRELQSLLHASNLNNLKAIVFGRFQRGSKIDNQTLAEIVNEFPELNNIPIIAGASFGHTYPIATFPIGGQVKISATSGVCKIEIINH